MTELSRINPANIPRCAVERFSDRAGAVDRRLVAMPVTSGPRSRRQRSLDSRTELSKSSAATNPLLIHVHFIFLPPECPPSGDSAAPPQIDSHRGGGVPAASVLAQFRDERLLPRVHATVRVHVMQDRHSHISAASSQTPPLLCASPHPLASSRPHPLCHARSLPPSSVAPVRSKRRRELVLMPRIQSRFIADHAASPYSPTDRRGRHWGGRAPADSFSSSFDNPYPPTSVCLPARAAPM